MKKTLILMAVLALTACGSSPKNTDGKAKQTPVDPPCPVGSSRTFEGTCQSDTVTGSRRPAQQPAASRVPRPQGPSRGVPSTTPMLGR